MILCTTTKHLVHNLAGQIFFERKKPANLEESIVLLEVAGQAAMNGEQGRIQHMFDRGPKTASELTSDAIEHGDAFVAAGRLAHRASSTLRVWRDRLYEDSVSHEREKAGLALIGVDEVMSMPGLFCDDESGLEGRGAAYQHGQRKERLLAQLWVASRGEDD